MKLPSLPPPRQHTKPNQSLLSPDQPSPNFLPNPPSAEKLKQIGRSNFLLPFKPINNLSQSIFPLNIYTYTVRGKMTEKVAQHKTILIPHTHHAQQFERYHKEAEETKTFSDVKLFITPNRESRPLGLASIRPYPDSSYDQRFQPSFDNFSLSSMFINKTLTEQEMAEFKKDKQGITEIFETPARKKNQNSACRQPEQASRHIHSEVKKSRPKEKGLRQLSQRAYEIVLNLRSASYKEVANKLVDQLNSEKELDQQIMRSRIEEKDEQNIKRRVYDALNVLIALGVLRKQGRKIVGDRSIKLKFEEADKNLILEQIQAKQRQIRRKKEEMLRWQAKYANVALLINQNQARVQQCPKIDLPFMIINAPSRNLTQKLADEFGGCLKLDIRGEKETMKMDIDCFTEYKMQEKTHKL